MFEADGRNRLYVRLGKSKRDRRLAAHIAADIERGVNVSKIAKELLYNYYTGAPLPTHTRPAVPEPSEDARQAALSAKLKKINFGGVG
jgi:hypothetical protein